jgi:hypothetical protein
MVKLAAGKFPVAEAVDQHCGDGEQFDVGRRKWGRDGHSLSFSERKRRADLYCNKYFSN